MNNYQFDFGMGSSRNKSLNDQKSPATSSFSSYSSSAAQPKPSWQSNKPSWTHQPAPAQTSRPGLNGPASMVGDISGKSWNSFAPSSGGSTVGIVNKDPALFGDLVGSAMGGKGSMNSNVPLKNVAPSKSPYSMGNLADSLPKRNDPVKTSGNWGSTGGYNGVGSNVNVNVSSNKGSTLGGPSMKSVGGGGIGGGINANRDPFGSLVDFSSKQSSSTLNSGSKAGNKAAADSFGDFQHASKPSTKPSTTSFQSSGFASNNNDFMGSNANAGFDMGGFGMPTNNVGSQSQKPVNSSGGDPLDMFFSSSSASSGGAKPVSGGAGEHQFSGVDDWGTEPDFGTGGIDEGGSTTELEGLPPPPAGVSAASAKSKGVDNKNQGQYADAIKWLSWAVILLEKAGNKADSAEVLSCRASCYKEVGEYKKAVADCSKVLENDKANVSVLVQRALLYESMEKYRLGAEDLRAVLKIDPANRVARSTVHRLEKMAD